MHLFQANRRLVLGALSVFVLGSGVFLYWFLHMAVDVPVSDVRFVSLDGAKEINTRFDGDVAVVSGLGLEAVALTQVETVSGARYEDRQSGITLWRNGAEATLYKNGAIVFTGTEGVPQLAPQNDTAGPVAEQLFGVRWVWRETIMSDGATALPSTPDRFTVTFAEGTVTGATDCNNFSGSFTLARATLTTGPFRSTKMYCAGSTEQEFLKVLEGQSTVLFDVTGNLVLLLPNDSGSVFFTKATSSDATR
jgi:heat shock protein HslJ